MKSIPWLFSLGLVLLAPPAPAQINSPPPPLMGQPSFHLYSVPGVLATGTLRTFFACTNTSSANIRVGVEIFSQVGGPGANDPSATSLELPPGATRIFGSAALGIPVDSSVVGPISKGSARILATSKKGIICTAFVANPGNDPPTSMAQLTIVAKTKQKGD